MMRSASSKEERMRKIRAALNQTDTVFRAEW